MPGLGSVPLIVILVITAVKDAIEDYRRTVLDNELNNTPIHILQGIENHNVADENISHWRRIKKATSRGMRFISKQLKKKKEPQQTNGLHRTVTNASVRTMSTHHRESIQMTPVPSKRESMSANRGSKADSGLPITDGFDPRTGQRGKKDSVPDRHQRLQFKERYWKDVKIGDFVRLYNDEEIPADIVILSSSDPEGNCFIETKNLDGETNLKSREALKGARSVRHAKDCANVVVNIDSEPPHANLYSYSAVANWYTEKEDDDGVSEEITPEPVSINNLLLRGCTIRNTKWVIGLVVFTGDETKMMMNAGITPSKRSRITRELNLSVRNPNRHWITC